MNKMILFAVALIAQYGYGSYDQMGVNKESAAAPARQVGGFTASATAPAPQFGAKKAKRETPPPAKNGGQILPTVVESPPSQAVSIQPQLVQQNAAAGVQGNPHAFNPYAIYYANDESVQPVAAPLDRKNYKTQAEAAPAHSAPTGGAAAAVQLHSHQPAHKPVFTVEVDESRMTLQVPPAGTAASPSQPSSMRFAHDFVQGSGVNDNHSHNPASDGPRRGSMASAKKSSVVSVPSAAVPVVVNSQVKRDDEYQRQLFNVHQQGTLDRAIGAAKRRYINKIKQNNPAKNIADMANKKLAAKGKENTTFTQEVEYIYRDLFFLDYDEIIENYRKQFPDYVEQLKANKDQAWEEILERAHRGCCVIL